MTPSQARAARAMLKLGVREVADLAKVTPNTVSRVEQDDSGPRGPQAVTVDAIRRVYETTVMSLPGLEWRCGGSLVPFRVLRETASGQHIPAVSALERMITTIMGNIYGTAPLRRMDRPPGIGHFHGPERGLATLKIRPIS
jgi:transcriptional regulator with XRE-family HTH domain